jgi:aminopeptidase N
VEDKAAPKPIFRKDYLPPPYLVDTVNLTFQLGEEVTLVRSKLHLKPNHGASAPPALFLNGREDVKLVSIKVNGADVPASGYQVPAGAATRTRHLAQPPPSSCGS